MLDLPPKLKKKHDKDEVSLKHKKEHHYLHREPNALSRRVDCTDMFKAPDKETAYMVQYYYSAMGGKDLHFDIRMFPRGAEPKKLLDTIMITSMAGRVGIKKVIDFVANNKLKFIKIRKGVLKMLKNIREKAKEELDPKDFKKDKEESED